MQGKTKGGTQTERHPVIRYPRLNVGKSRRAGAKRRKKTVLTPPLGGAGLICVNPRLKNSFLSARRDLGGKINLC